MNDELHIIHDHQVAALDHQAALESSLHSNYSTQSYQKVRDALAAVTTAGSRRQDGGTDYPGSGPDAAASAAAAAAAALCDRVMELEKEKVRTVWLE